MLLSELSIILPGKELAGSERKESIKPQVLHHQNDRGEQKQQELLRPLGEVCPNDCHTSSVEPVEQKWRGRLSGLIALLPAPGFQAPTYQPYCVQPDTKWKEHSTRLQRAGARLHVEPPQLSLKLSPSSMLLFPHSHKDIRGWLHRAYWGTCSYQKLQW